MNTVHKTKIERKTHKIDASGASLGRLASQISLLLRGKQKRDFSHHLDKGDFVAVKNVAKMKISTKKLEQKKYYRHSGYPGGLKEKSLRELFENNPAEVLKKAVWNMLPKNKLRKEMIKRLRINN